MALATIPVGYHIGSSRLFDEIPEENQKILTEFLKVITARNLIPPVVHKNNRRLWYRFEDTDPSTAEGLDELMLLYELSLSLFLGEHERAIQKTGESIITFTPVSPERSVFSFAIERSEKHGRETLFQHTLRAGKAIRHERNTYTIVHTNNEYTLTMQDIFTPGENDHIITFPQSINTEGLKKVLDVDKDDSWKTGFDYIPFSFLDKT